tara:strand:+ start:2483 stop:2587 length:105 start_codon:yes stop_codon:yes gene_type:complete
MTNWVLEICLSLTDLFRIWARKRKQAGGSPKKKE